MTHSPHLMPVAALLLCGLALAAPSVAAQRVAPPGTLEAAVGASFETYEFLDGEPVGIERLSLLALPFAVRSVPLPRLQLQVSSAFARGWLARTDGSDASLSGLTDTELRASYVIGEDRVVVSAAFLAPTGKRSLTLDEAEVAGTLAADLLPFRVTQWGTGGGVQLGTAVAVPVGEFGLGFSVGYSVASEFDALALPDETWSYRPGNELRVRLGVDRTLGTAGKAALIANLQHYGDDELEGESLLSPGTRFDLTGYYAFAAGATANGVVYLGVAHREAGTFALEDTEIPAQDLIFLGTGLRVPLGRVVLVPSLEGRVFRRSDGIDQGHLAGIGASLEWPVGSVTLVPVVRSRFGKVLLWEGAESSFRGGEFGVSIRMGTGRR